MPYAIIILITKKPGLSLREFRDYHENIYIPDMKRLCGPVFPLKHIRRYLANEGDDEKHKKGFLNLPSILVGHPDEIGWDCLAELTFQDELHFNQFYSQLNEPETADVILEHEEKFSDRDKLKFIIMESYTAENQYITTKD